MMRPFIQWDQTRPGFGRADYAAADRVCRATTGPKNAQRHVWSNVERYLRLLQDGYHVSGEVGWVAPIGVATPLWGATNPIDIARPTLPSPWTSNTAGWYFVQSGGTNSGNGYPGSPRGSFPTPSAGEKVVLNGTWSTQSNPTWTGTAANPIWLMGYDTGSMPTLSNYWGIGTAYVIYDHLHWLYNQQDSTELAGNHNLIRDCTLDNSYDTSNGSGIGFGGTYNIIYNLTIPRCGNWLYTGGSDIDRHGIKVEGGSVADAWVVDSTIYHCHGDGIQVADQNNAASSVNRVYIGRNTFYENYQTGAWTKNATDVIFSENTAHTILQTSAYGVGSGLGGQYDAKYVWYIANKIYSCLSGIHIAGADNGGGGPWYAIGNAISNIDYPSGDLAYDGGAIGNRNEGAMTAIFNTIYDVDCFISVAPGPSPYRVYNNIFSTLKSGGTSFANGGTTLTHNYNLFTSSAYDPDGEANRVVGNPLFVNAATRNFALQATSPARDMANPTEEAAFAAFQTRYGLDIRKDILGGTRPFGTRWDMGAYEYGATSGATPPVGTPVLSVR